MKEIILSTNPVKLIFGKEGFERLLNNLPYDNVLLITTKGHTTRDTFIYIKFILKNRLSITLDSVTPNPSIELINKIHSKVKLIEPDCIIALGGGSVIDTAKGVIRLLDTNIVPSLRDQIKTRFEKNTKSRLPLIAIPTTAGSGAEVTPFASIWDHNLKTKQSIYGRDLYPEPAVICPEFTITVPLEETIYTGLDTISHALESTWNKNANEETLMLSRLSLANSLDTLPKLVKEPENVQFRTKMIHASLMSGLAISHTKTALAHSISYPLTARYGLPHGFACSFTLKEILLYNKLGDDGRIQHLAEFLGYNNIEGLANKINLLFKSIELKKYLKKYKLRRSYHKLISSMITKDRANNHISNFKEIDIMGILERSITEFAT